MRAKWRWLYCKINFMIINCISIQVRKKMCVYVLPWVLLLSSWANRLREWKNNFCRISNEQNEKQCLMIKCRKRNLIKKIPSISTAFAMLFGNFAMNCQIAPQLLVGTLFSTVIGKRLERTVIHIQKERNSIISIYSGVELNTTHHTMQPLKTRAASLFCCSF